MFKRATAFLLAFILSFSFCFAHAENQNAGNSKPLISCSKTEVGINEPFYLNWYAPDADWCVLWECYEGENTSLGFVDKDEGHYKLQLSVPGTYLYYLASMKNDENWEYSDSVSVCVSADKQNDSNADFVFYSSKTDVEIGEPVCLSWYAPEADWCVLWERRDGYDDVSLGFVNKDVSHYIIQHSEPGLYYYYLATMKNNENWEYSQFIPVMVAVQDDDTKCEYLRYKGMNNIWNMLFMVYRNVDIGSFQNSFSDRDIASMKRIASEMEYTLEGISDGRMQVGTVDVVVVDDPVTSASEIYSYGGPPGLTYGKDGDVDFTYILDHRDINLVCAVAPILGLNNGYAWAGMGGSQLSFKGRLCYTVICNMIPDSDVQNECGGKYYPEECLLFVHEILHAVETNSRNNGYFEYEELHSGDINGYGNGHYGWYRPLMTDTLNNGKRGFLKQSYYVSHKSISKEMSNGLHEDYDGVWRYYIDGLPVFADADLFLPYTLETIESEAFRGLPVQSILIPPTVQSIAWDAFSPGITIYGKSGSYAETWAGQNGYPFVKINR